MDDKVTADNPGKARQTEMKTILIVDDLPMMRTVIRNILTQLNAHSKCIEAEDGLDALRCLANTKVDLILLDWKMPNLSGIDFVKRVRALKLDVPVIMITGESGHANVAQALKSGISDYILKPVTKEILKEKLVKLGMVSKKA
jgi:two-component system chemotaxis response regulator CheY